jgi:hypothetical protein
MCCVYWQHLLLRALRCQTPEHGLMFLCENLRFVGPEQYNTVHAQIART